MNYIMPNGPLLPRSSGLFALRPRAAASTWRADDDRGLRQVFSRLTIKLALCRLVLEALAAFSVSSSTCLPMILPAILYWLVRKCFASCAENRKPSEETRIRSKEHL
jgi:hypothetical protein